jgi:hypothetical protein
MTDWTGGPDPEFGRELDEDYGRLDEPAEQEDPVAEDPDYREPSPDFYWNRELAPERPDTA